MLLCVNQFGFASFGLTAEDFMKEDSIIQMGYPPLRIDLLTTIDGVTFKECYKNRLKVDIQGLIIDFIGLSDLQKNKKESGRLRDLDDLDQLTQ
jgi:hypothetical protein